MARPTVTWITSCCISSTSWPIPYQAAFALITLPISASGPIVVASARLSGPYCHSDHIRAHSCCISSTIGPQIAIAFFWAHSWCISSTIGSHLALAKHPAPIDLQDNGITLFSLAINGEESHSGRSSCHCTKQIIMARRSAQVWQIGHGIQILPSMEAAI